MIRPTLALSAALLAFGAAAALPPMPAFSWQPEPGRARFRNTKAQAPIRSRGRIKRKHARRASGTLKHQRSR